VRVDGWGSGLQALRDRAQRQRGGVLGARRGDQMERRANRRDTQHTHEERWWGGVCVCVEGRWSGLQALRDRAQRQRGGVLRAVEG